MKETIKIIITILCILTMLIGIGYYVYVIGNDMIIKWYDSVFVVAR